MLSPQIFLVGHGRQRGEHSAIRQNADKNGVRFAAVRFVVGDAVCDPLQGGAVEAGCLKVDLCLSNLS